MNSANCVENVLLKYINAVLKKWTALQLAIEHGMGGPYAREKEEWFVLEIEKFLLNNDGLECYEVEDFISDILNEEFDTICEDGSLAEVAQKVLNASLLYRAGSLDELINLMPPETTSQVRSSVAALTEEEEKASVELQMAPLNTNFQHLKVEDNNHSEKADMSDEWTVVTKGRRRK